MKQEILTLEQGQVADMLLSLKNSHRRINRFLQDYTPPLNGDRYLTDKEVAEALKVSRRTLQNLRNNRVLPFILLGGKALYREYDIQRLLEANYRRADVLACKNEKDGRATLMSGIVRPSFFVCYFCPFSYSRKATGE